MVESYQWQTELWGGNHAGWMFSYQLMPVWLVCVPSSSKKELLSSACGLLHCFLAYKPSSLLPVAFINYHMLPSCGCQLILHAQSCAQVETHKPRKPPFSKNCSPDSSLMNNALIGKEVLIYSTQEKHLVLFPELIGFVEHEIKEHMSDC